MINNERMKKIALLFAIIFSFSLASCSDANSDNSCGSTPSQITYESDDYSHWDSTTLKKVRHSNVEVGDYCEGESHYLNKECSVCHHHVLSLFLIRINIPLN